MQNNFKKSKPRQPNYNNELSKKGVWPGLTHSRRCSRMSIDLVVLVFLSFFTFCGPFVFGREGLSGELGAG